MMCSELEGLSDKEKSFYSEEECYKEVVFQSDSEEDFVDGKRLTSLVRESYLRHLRQLLAHNYEVWCANCNNSVDAPAEGTKILSPIDIENCLRFLEQRALRSCMIASLYQKSMIDLIADIKRKTKEMVLFNSLRNIELVHPRRYACDKCVQTEEIKSDIVNKERCNSKTQALIVSDRLITDSVVTDKSYSRTTTSLLDLPLPDPRDVLHSLGTDFLERISKEEEITQTLNVKKSLNLRSFRGSSSVKRKSEYVKLENGAVQSESKRGRLNFHSNNIVLVNDNDIVPENSENVSPREIVNNNFDLLCTGTDESGDNKSRCVNKNVSSVTNIIEDNNLMNLVNDLIEFDQCVYDNNFSVSDSICADKNKILTESGCEKTRENSVNGMSLDDRLAEMGVMIDDNSDCLLTHLNEQLPQSQVNLSLKSKSVRGSHHSTSWHFEMIAHYCNFAKIFLSLDSIKKAKIKKKICRLFGSFNSNMELTEDNLSVCRKRAANMVVAELTPYFESKRIASRGLFKEFAKRVTDSIVSRTYAPDFGAVNTLIREYFEEHECVQSMDDIDFQ